MITVQEAIDLIHQKVRPLAAEPVPLADSLGRVLREAIVADTDLPPFDRAQMDGYAVREAELPGRLPVAGTAYPGDLAGTPATGLFVNACGDMHVSNFGVFASAERAAVAYSKALAHWARHSR